MNILRLKIQNKPRVARVGTHRIAQNTHKDRVDFTFCYLKKKLYQGIILIFAIKYKKT